MPQQFMPQFAVQNQNFIMAPNMIRPGQNMANGYQQLNQNNQNMNNQNNQRPR